MLKPPIMIEALSVLPLLNFFNGGKGGKGNKHQMENIERKRQFNRLKPELVSYHLNTKGPNTTVKTEISD